MEFEQVDNNVNVSKFLFLIFLDEPTSGLDGQSAYNTVRFLRRLADAGQAVLVTEKKKLIKLGEKLRRWLMHGD
jgi:ABC-type hemin transport system ATPase subunit